MDILGVGIVISHSCNYYEIFFHIFSAISCDKLSFICLGFIKFLKSLNLCLLIVLEIFWPLFSPVFLWSHFLALLLLGLQLHLCDILSGFHIFLMLCSLLTLFSFCASDGLFSIGMFLSQPNMSSLSQFSSVTQSCLTLCDPMNHITPGLPVHLQLPEFTQTHVH